MYAHCDTRLVSLSTRVYTVCTCGGKKKKRFLSKCLARSFFFSKTISDDDPYASRILIFF